MAAERRNPRLAGSLHAFYGDRTFVHHRLTCSAAPQSWPSDIAEIRGRAHLEPLATPPNADF